MSAAAHWTVGVAGLLFAVSGFLPFTASAHVWTAIVLGAIVGAVGPTVFARKLEAKRV